MFVMNCGPFWIFDVVQFDTILLNNTKEQTTFNTMEG